MPPNSLTETFSNGATRERLITETSGGRNYYIWGGQSVIAEYAESGSGKTPEYQKGYVYAGSRLLMTATKASSSTETKEFHHRDRLGTQLVTDGGAGTSYRQTTFPFGTSISAETPGNSNQVFTSFGQMQGGEERLPKRRRMNNQNGEVCIPLRLLRPSGEFSDQRE